MKNYLRNYCKKTTAIFLAALMLISCWVWIAPDKAEAQSAGTYSVEYFINVRNGETVNGSNRIFRIYYKENNGTGTERSVDQNISGWNLYDDGYRSGTTTLSGFPTRITVQLESQDRANTNGELDVTCGLKVNGTEILSNDENISNGSTGSWKRETWNWYVGADKYPYLNNINFSGTAVTGTKEVTTAWTTSSDITMRPTDQYGVNLYMDSITGTRCRVTHSGANPIAYDVSDNSTEESVGTNYYKVNDSYSGGIFHSNIQYRAFATTKKAVKYVLTPITYTMSWAGYNGTKSLSATWNNSATINNPYTDITFNAQGGATEPNDASPYGNASGTSATVAKIGGASASGTQRLYYNWNINSLVMPSDTDENATYYIARPYYTFISFSSNSSSKASEAYITHQGTLEEQGYAQAANDGYVDDTRPYGDGIVMGSTSSAIMPNGSSYGNTKTFYGWWEPNHATVRFVNADGNLLYSNPEQDMDHYAYYGGAYPTYTGGGNTFTNYAFAGWINMTTGDLISGTGYGYPGLLSTANQYVYGDVTYMAYYTATKASNYSVTLDFNGDGIINSDDGDLVSGGHQYYDKIYRKVDVPSLTGEVFGTRSWYNWVDAGISASSGTVDYSDNGLTLTSTSGNDCYSSWSPVITVEPNTTYNFTFDFEDLTTTGMTGSIEFFQNYRSNGTNCATPYTNSTFSTPGTCTGSFTTPAGCNQLRIRFDANNAGNVIKFTNISVYNKSNMATKASTALVDYSDPIWVSSVDGSSLTPNTRMIEESQAYETLFAETPVYYSLTLITGSNNGNVTLTGSNYVASATNGVSEETDTYTWGDTITLNNPGNFADGVYDYQFAYWIDSHNNRRDIGYNLVKASGINAADGIYNDEYIRADGYNETGLDTMTYRAVYTRTAKTYKVNFVQEDGVTEISGKSWTGDYQTILPVVAPADQTKVDTLEENNPLRYTYSFVGWDNIKTPAVENYSAASLNAYYSSNGVVADATYKAVFSSTYHYYVTYMNYDNLTEVAGYTADWYTYGEVINSADLPENNGASIVTPPSNQIYTYTVSGWATGVNAPLVAGTTTVTSDITYIAQLEQTYQEYDVDFYDEDGMTPIGTVADVPYGSKPQNIGMVPTANKPQTEQYVYTFVGWDDMSTPNVIENIAAADLDVVHGNQEYKAIYRQSKRGYEIVYKIPQTGNVTYNTSAPMSITAGSYENYVWTDSGINFGVTRFPTCYFGERVTTPAITPTLTNPTIPTGFEIVFVGWYTGPNGTGDQLGRTTRIISESSPTTYYAYYQYVGLEYSVQFYEDIGVTAPFYTIPTIGYGGSATAEAATAQAMLTPYFDADNHYAFDKWVLSDGTTPAASSLASVTGALKVYAKHVQVAHTFTAWTETTPATYTAAGVETRSCTGCACTETRAIERLKDTTAPTGVITVRTDNTVSATTIGTSNSFITDYSDNTAYTSGKSVDVQISTSDIGLGIKELYYAVDRNGEPKTMADALSYDWAGAYVAGDIEKVNLRNAHFTVTGEDDDYVIVYVYALDNAVTWATGDVVNGEPTATTPSSNVVYLSSIKVVFDVDSPVIGVTNSSNHYNADKTVFCNNADISVTDSFLSSVEITKDGVSYANATVTTGSYTRAITEAGVYVVTALDITGKETVYTFTVQTGHDYDADNDGINESYVYTDPTCTENGFRTYTCVICGTDEIVYDDPNTTLGHDYDIDNDGTDDYTITTPATCEAEGSKVYICERCDYINEASRVSIPAIGHDYQLTEDVAATCGQAGHKTYVCANDSAHAYTENFTALGHEYELYSHTPATCGVNGYNTFRCVRFDECGSSYNVDIPEEPALEHNYSSEVIYEATCTHYGVKKFTCANCGDIYYEQIAKIPHTYEWTTTTHPTCYTTGIEKYICSVCGAEDTATAPRELAKTAHEYGEWTVVTEATCTENGSMQRKCKNFSLCGAAETEVIEALGHDYQYTSTVVATTEHGGYELWTCSRCGTTEQRNVTPALAAYTVSVYNEDGITLIDSIGTTGGDILTASDITTTAPAKTGYTFDKWVYADGTEITWPVTVAGNISVKPAYTINSYTITWKAGDLADEVDTVNYSETPTYDGATPVKATDAYYSYTFAGWSTDANADAADVLVAIPSVTANATYYAIFSKTGVEYDITWKSWDGTTIATTQAAYNTIPECTVTNVADTEDDTATYAWDGGWTPQIKLVTGDATYTATYTATPKIYSVYFFNEGSETSNLSNAVITQNYCFGDTFVLPAGITKSATEQHTYTFNAWNEVEGQTATAPEGTIVAANQGFKYVASFLEHNIDYTVTFKDDAGNVIDTDTLLFDSDITAPETPVKAVPAEDEGKYEYVFTGWKYRGVTYEADALPSVSDNMVFVAVFEQVYNDFSVKFMRYDGTGEPYAEMEVNYGDAISYNGPSPFIPRTAQYTYKFLGWATESESSAALETLGTATADVTYYAAFEVVLRKYNISFNVNGTKTDNELEYGATVAYTGTPESLVKVATAYKTYTFAGWTTTLANVEKEIAEYAPDATLPTVAGAATYYAVYTSVTNQVTATWVNEGTQLAETTGDYGFEPVYTGTPTKETDDGVEGANYTYAFAGWVDQDGTEYAPDASFGRIVKDMTYTAKFDKVYETYTATFKKGDDVVATSASYKYGDALTVPASPASYDEDFVHYIFAGWSTDGTTVIDLAGVTVTADIEYVAVFSETPFDTFNIIFMNGYTEYDAREYITDESVSAPVTDPTKASDAEGGDAEYYYSFVGWSIEEGNADQIVADWSAVKAIADETYYAIYEKEYPEYTITFRKENGDYLTLAKYNYGATVTLPEDMVKASDSTYDYTFAGWSATKGGAAAAVPAVTGNATYYAVFTSELRSYSVAFVNYDGTVIAESNTYRYGDALAKPAESPVKPEDDGHTYSFKEWSPLVPTSVTKSATYTAQFNTVDKTFEVFFYDVNLDGSLKATAYNYRSYIYNAALIIPDAPTRMDTAQYDYTFLGWALADDETNTVIEPTANVIAGASYKAVYSTVVKQYSVVFKAYDATVLSTQTVDYGAFATAPADQVREEDNTYTYAFEGWNNGTDNVAAATINATAVTGNVTYTAAFTPTYKEYTVTFLNEDDTILDTENYHYDAAVNMPESPTKTVLGETWVFTGWTADDGATVYTTVPTVKESITYKAVFTGGIDRYTVTFYANGHSFAKTYTYGQTLDMTGVITDKAPTSQYTYTFAGWSTTENGAISEPVTTVTQSANYFAVYTASEITYTVDWVVEGVTTHDEYIYNETIKLPATPVKAGVEGDYGFNFVGWSTEAGNAAKVVVLNNVKVKADATYYAIFEQEVYTYTVTFRFGGTGNFIGRETYNYNADLSGIAHPSIATVYDDVNFKKTEYTFLGWATEKTATVAAYATSALLPAVTADIIYYAIFSSETTDYTPEYTITFMNGSAEFDKDVIARGSTPVADGTPTRVADANYHYVFKGWVANADGTGAVYTTLPEALADATYYAAYTRTAHSLVYDDDASYSCSLGGQGMDVWNCSVCGYEKVSMHDAVHDYVLDPAGTHNPTYRNNGSGYYVCSNCGVTKSETIDRLGRPVTFKVVNENGDAVSGATVTVFYEGAAIDASTTGSDGNVTLFVPKSSGNYTVVIDANGYSTTTGTIHVDEDGDVTTNFGALKSLYCSCTCHKDNLWATIFRFFYKMLHSLFGVECCDCNTYL